jgi:16S rRNA (cytidine1402-2'-O)-methyltransferase
VETLEDMREIFGSERAAAVARELTKVHESVYRGPLARLLQIAADDANFTRGEITLVVSGREAAAPDDAFALRALELLAAELPPSRAAAVVAQLTGRHKAEVYALLHQPATETP